MCARSADTNFSDVFSRSRSVAEYSVIQPSGIGFRVEDAFVIVSKVVLQVADL